MKLVHTCVAVAALCAQVSFAAKKTLEQYWQDSGLKFSFVEEELSSTNCYQNERTFLGCVYALNAAIAYEGESLVLVPKARVQAETGYGPAKADFVTVVLATPPKFSSDEPVALYKHFKEDREAGNKAWKALFAQGTDNLLPFELVVDWLKRSPAFKDKEAAMTGSAVNGLLGVTKDPHTMLLPAAYVDDESSNDGDDFTGIGVILKTLKQSGQEVHVIDEPVEGGPAITAGVHANDVLLEIDGKSVDGLSADQITGLIRGPQGQPVKLTLRRKGQNVTITVVRDKIHLPNVSAKLLGNDVGYVKLASFMKSDGCEAVQGAVTDLESKGAKSLILDLRENGGGLIVQAQCIANVFLKKDELVVFTRTLDGSQVEELRTQHDAQTNLPLVVLVNPHSASASELLSGALQDNRRAFVVGERSFGKGSVQNQGRLRGGQLVIRQTIAKFFLPSGRSNQILGVSPDIEVFKNPNPTEEDKFALREEDEYMAFESAEKPWQQPRPEEVAQLQACVHDNGTAAHDFASSTDAAVRPDYQLLVAADTARCEVRLGFQSEEAHPDFRAPKVPQFHWGKPLHDALDSIWRKLNERHLP